MQRCPCLGQHCFSRTPNVWSDRFCQWFRRTNSAGPLVSEIPRKNPSENDRTPSPRVEGNSDPKHQALRSFSEHHPDGPLHHGPPPPQTHRAEGTAAHSELQINSFHQTSI